MNAFLYRIRPMLLAALLALPLTAGCSYVDKARLVSDAVVQAGQFYDVEALVQADIERKRMRAVRCHSPLLAPASLSAAATDSRLGSPWVDELLRDCPEFSAFLAELTLRRAVSSGLLLDRKTAQPSGLPSAGADRPAVEP